MDPSEEWEQIVHEAWRIERDYFYVDNMHGADWPDVRRRCAPWLDHVRHRSDLTYLLDVMAGELSVGHSFTGGGDEPDVDEVPVGLLGADLSVENGRYRIERIYTGAPWTPDVRAPLAEPGVDVSEGDDLLAAGGRDLRPPTNPYRLLDGTAERQPTLTVNDSPTAEGARRITVVPVGSDTEVLRRAWVEHDRALVDALSDGRLGGDPQLERAVQEALRLLEERDWPRIRPEPDPPVRVKRPGEGGG